MRRDGGLKVAVVGGGWAGLAAAVRATEAGHRVSLFEMAPQLGGRARSVAAQGLALDNGQHILIGAYARTLALMATVGSPIEQGLHRRPLELRYPDGRGLRMPAGPAALGFAVAVARFKGWRTAERLAMLRAASLWAVRGFACRPGLSVAELCAGLPAAVRKLLIDPLCVAALNTPAEQASAQVFLRVLRDAVFGDRGSADLLLPRRPLGSLLPEPAAAWLRAADAEVRTRTRVLALQAQGSGWRLDGETFDRVILACTAVEAARLAEPLAPAWAEQARRLRYEPIVTVYLQCSGARLPAPMTALCDGPQAPAQFAFDHGALGATPGLFAFVVSGAAAWVRQGLPATASAVLHQAQTAFAHGTWPTPLQVVHVAAERRATFACTPALNRPQARVVPGLLAAGDYVQGPYPATLEGAVRSGELAASLVDG